VNPFKKEILNFHMHACRNFLIVCTAAYEIVQKNDGCDHTCAGENFWERGRDEMAKKFPKISIWGWGETDFG
jgi:hypothetical protein